VRIASEERTRVATTVNELYALEQVRDAATMVELVIVGSRSEPHRAAIARAVSASIAAGITEVEVTRVQSGLHVSVPRRSAELALRLAEVGFVREEASPDTAAIYGLTMGRGQPQFARRDSDLPAGYSPGF
jgi:hypothetical protein